MTALSGPMSRVLTVEDPSPTKLRVKAAAVIHKGSRLCHVSGAVEPLVGATHTAAAYVGIANESAVGGAADGDVYVEVQRNVEEEVTSIGTYTGDNLNAAVYAVDDGTDQSHDNTGRIKIGEISGFFDGRFRIKHICALMPA